MPFSWQITIADNASTDITPEIARALAGRSRPGSCPAGRAEGTRSGAAGRVVGEPGGRRRVHGRRPLDRSARALAAARAAGLGPQRGRDRLATGEGIAGHARPEARVHLAHLQPHPALGAARTLHRRPVRVQGRPRPTLCPSCSHAVRDESWFFDTELLIAAQRRGMRVHEVPVDWIDDPDSRVDIVSTALADLRGVARLAMATPVARFVAIGVVSTLAYALLFLALRRRGWLRRRERGRARSHGGREHRGQPAPDVRYPRARRPSSPAGRRVPRVRARARAHERCAERFA